MDSKISLLISENRKARYAALSYCWGGPQALVAEEDTLDAMARGIALSMLPKTVQDAVTVTRRLGLQYLWVDALCIKQDSEEDWISESSKMADIYGNAAVTIAAASGRDCNAGCFIKDNSVARHMLESIRPHPMLGRFKLRLPDSNIGTIFLGVQNYHDPLEEPLNTRGWALQERLLSPRLLIYSSGNVSWQCQTKSNSSGIGSARLPDFFFDEALVNSHEMWQWNRGIASDSSITLETFWTQISLDYSHRSVTRDHDKLPALSGLASRFRDVTGDVYLAGLWKKTLCQGLMWETIWPQNSRPSICQAPTWSWLSAQVPIRYVHARRARDAPLIRIVEADTVLESPDQTGAVVSGKITLYGQMKQAQQKDPQRLYSDLWGVGPEELVRVGRAFLDLESEVIEAMDGPLWCLRVSDDEGLLLKYSGENYQRVGIFVLGLDVISWGITGSKWFEGSGLRTMTLV
jgi:hypothetical protein